MNRRRLCSLVAVLVLVSSLLLSCGGGEDVNLSPTPGGRAIVPLEVTSPAFNSGQQIPVRYAGKGDNLSPTLRWEVVPEGTRSIALVVDDPDAKGGTWIHWLVFNIPPQTRELPEGVTPDQGLPPGAAHGENTWRRAEYGGPSPPSGTHRYYFRVYALDTVLDLEPGIRSKHLIRAMKGHVLGYGELMARYGN